MTTPSAEDIERVARELCTAAGCDPDADINSRDIQYDHWRDHVAFGTVELPETLVFTEPQYWWWLWAERAKHILLKTDPCNRCGNTTRFGDENSEYVECVGHWGYYSNNKDMSTHTFRLCDACYEHLRAEFVVPVTIEDSRAGGDPVFCDDFEARMQEFYGPGVDFRKKWAEETMRVTAITKRIEAANGLTDAVLARLESRALAATPGPYTAFTCEGVASLLPSGRPGSVAESMQPEDASYFAVTDPQTILGMVLEIRSLRAALGVRGYHED